MERRILRLESDLSRLENGLASDEIRAALLAQQKAAAIQAGGATPPPAIFALTLNFRIALNAVAPGGWAGTTITITNGVGSPVGPVGTTDAWGYWSDWFVIPEADVGLTYTATFTHAGRTTQTATVLIGAFGLNNFAASATLV